MGGTKRPDRADNDTSVEDAGLEREKEKQQYEAVSGEKYSVLLEAQEIIHGERNESYGEPAKNHGTTAELFNAFLFRKYGEFCSIDADDVCWFNIFQKISREANCSKRDNLVDIAGYVGNIEMMQSGDYGRSVMEDEQERTLKQNEALRVRLEEIRDARIQEPETLQQHKARAFSAEI